MESAAFCFCVVPLTRKILIGVKWDISRPWRQIIFLSMRNLVLNGEFERDIAYEALNDFLGNGKRVAFDAVFTGDDDAAIGVLKALHKHGFRIPEDVAVIGFDDLGFAPFLNPPSHYGSCPN